MTDIEKVARALCDDAGCVWDHDPQALSRAEWRKAACAAIAAMQPAPQWQGIESDTTVERCFLWCTDKVPTGIVVGSIRNGKARSTALIGDWTFTHWMPLPTPPAGGSDAE